MNTYRVGVKVDGRVVHVTLEAEDFIDAEWKALQHCRTNLGYNIKGEVDEIAYHEQIGGKSARNRA